MQVPLLDLSAQFARIRPDVLRAIEAVCDSQRFILGPTVEAFERAVAGRLGAAHAIGMSSGTDALLAALMAAGVGPGDDVVTPTYSFFATAGCVWRLGARPVLVDVDPATLNATGEAIAAAMTPKTKAIIPVHLYGQMADMPPILAAAARQGAVVIEDACQAIDAADASGKAGTVGAMGAFSFFPSKNLGGFGDGGLTTTNDDGLARQLRLLRGHGAATRYHHEIVGGNFRLDALQAAVLTAKLPYLDAWTAGRRANAARYRALFAEAAPGAGVSLAAPIAGPDAGRRPVAAGRAAGRDARLQPVRGAPRPPRRRQGAPGRSRRRLRGVLPGAVPPAGVLRAAGPSPRRLPDRGGGGGRFAGAADLSGADGGAAALRGRCGARGHDPDAPGRSRWSACMMRPVDPSAGGVAGPVPAAVAPSRRGPGATTRILIGLVLGVVIGWLWPAFATDLRPLAEVFLRMIRMIIGPLLFSTLVVGIAGTGDLKAMGRIGAKALIYFEVATTFALVLGLGLVNLLRPGAGVPAEAGSVAELQAMAVRQQGPWDIVLHMFPTSLIDALARNDVLQVVVFATFFGVAVAATGEKARPVATLLDAAAQVMFTVTSYVMWFAPIGVMAAVAATVGSKGLGVLLTLGKLVGAMYLGYVLFVLLMAGGALLIARIPIGAFIAAVREPVLIAFTTASSEAALPKALEAMERFGVPRSIVGFVLPTGYSFNLDGSTVYLSMATVFVAQMAGVELTWGQQLTMLLTLMLTSKGVAGVPRASLVVLMATLTTFGPAYGIPLEGAAILLGIDQILDMGRTAVNVIGNCVASVVVARWEGVFDDTRVKQAA